MSKSFSLINEGDGKAYVFKGDHYIRFNMNPKYEGTEDKPLRIDTDREIKRIRTPKMVLNKKNFCEI